MQPTAPGSAPTAGRTTCTELGIGSVAYSPFQRGFLSGQVRSIDDVAADDSRRQNPRFQEAAIVQNLELVDRVREIAEGEGMTATPDRPGPGDGEVRPRRRPDRGDRYPDISQVHRRAASTPG